jgi:PST family polysaccharide transporter
MLKTIIANAGWLGLVQLLNYSLPIFTLPVVTRAFGPSIFGTLAAINAYAAYVGLFVNYGFNLTGPRNVATSRLNAKELSKTVYATISAQAALGVVSALVFFVILAFLPIAPEYKLISGIVLLQVLATSMCPQWAFLGLERIRAFAFVQLIFRVIAAGVIIYSIRTPDDLPLYVTTNAGSSLLATAGSFVVLRSYGIRWQTPSFRLILSTLREAFGLFLSTISISLYTTTNVLIVTLVLGTSGAGPFALADRVRLATGGLLGPVTSAVYPFVCRIAHRDETAEERSTRQLFFCVIVIASALMSVALFVLAEPIVRLVGGDAFLAAVPVLRYMAFLPTIVALSNIFGVQTMIPMRMDRHVSYVVTSAAFIGSLSLLVFTHLWGLAGAGLAVLLVECFVTFLLGMILQSKMRVMSLFFA